MRRFVLVALVLFASVLAFPLTAQAAPVFVSQFGSDTLGDGSPLMPFATVQHAIDSAAAGDDVNVGPGTFCGNITMKDGVSIHGAGAASTTLKGTGTGSVVTVSSTGTGESIDGFTITGGSATYGGGIYCRSSSPAITNNTISGNSATNGGGGIYCFDSSPTISENNISGNSTDYGGGIYCLSSSPAITNNTISGNSASGFAFGDGGGGGGIYCLSSSPAITNNTISGNSVSGIPANGGGIYCLSSSPAITNNIITRNSANFGGGISCDPGSPAITNNIITSNSASYGGGIYCLSSSPAITNNTMSGNSATQYGAGIWCGGLLSSPAITNNTISGNSAFNSKNFRFGAGGGIYCCESSSPAITNNTITDNFSATYGGGIYSSYSSPAITNNTISGNSAPGYSGGNGGGGGIFIFGDGSAPTITNSTITGNSATTGGGIYCALSVPAITNSIVWGNGDDLLGCSATYSDIEDGDAGTGNISVAPSFVATSAGDFRLKAGSPCIDVATSTAAPAADKLGVWRPRGAGFDMGAHEYVDLAGPVAPVDPTLTSLTHTQGVWSKSATVTVDISSATGTVAPVAGFAISVSTGTTGYPLPIVTHSAGTSAFTFAATPGVPLYVNVATADAVGLWSAGTHFGPILVDTGLPAVSDDAPGGWRAHDVTVTVEATDALSGVAGTDVLVTGGGTPTVTHPSAGIATVALTDEGTTTIEYSAADVAGNRCATETATVRLDKSAPGLAITASPSSVSIEASDAVSGVGPVFYTVDGGAPQLYTGGSFSPGASGDHLIMAWCSDLAGNPTAKSAFVTVDTDAPTVSDDAPGGWQTGDVTVTITASDARSGIASIDWALSGASAGAGSSASSPAKVAISAEGTTTIEYSAIDVAGNRCATETAVVRIDKSAPHTTAAHVPGAPGAPVLVTLTPSDTRSGVASTWFRIGTGPASIYGGPFAVSTVGTTTVSFWSVDTAGNTEDPHSTTVHIAAPVVPDTTAPSVSDDAPGVWRAAPVTVRLRATDDGSGIARIEWLVTGPSGPPLAGQSAGSASTVIISEQGTSTLAYSAIDGAGNRCATETAIVRIDLTAPTLTIADSSTVSYLARLRLWGADTLSGVSAVGWRIGQEPTATLPVSEALVAYEVPGPHTITAWAIDVAGNRSASVVHTFTVTGPAWIEMLTTSRVLPAWGDPFVLEGRLSAEAGPIAGARVVAQSSSDGVGFSDCSAPVATAADGGFSITVVPGVRAIYRVRSLPGEGVPGVVGPGAWVLPRAFVGTPVAPPKAKVGKPITVSGTLKPRHAVGSKPVRVYLWRLEKGRWKAYGYKNATCANHATYSRYRVSLRLTKAGRWRMRAYHADSGHAASWSKNYDYLQVK
ncbi:MAG: right-handed parallel beta-helix repeat-containing protein [Coriobacteriia bacterium]|nr:right-handed parallel beta-helix repeat-containing protein [Coriobacteriia bacterium]